MAEKTESLLEQLKNGAPKKPRDELIDVSFANISVVDDVVELAEKLSRKKQNREAKQLVEIAKKILANNKRIQNAVGRMSR